MSCAVPGCQATDLAPVRIRARPATDLEREVLPSRQVANGELCGLHREEFAELGWLDETEDDNPG